LVTGVSEWWVRVAAPLFSLGSLFLVRHIAHLLWPKQQAAGYYAPLIVLGSVFWTACTGAAMFDMLLTFFMLLGVIGIIRATQGVRNGFVITGVAIGLGMLAKGPVILLLVLPTMLLMPLWRVAGEGPSLGRWYLGVLSSFLLGALIALAWAVPAGMAGGEAYRDAIFWGQSAGRMVKSFAHERAWWWYLPVLPVLLFPWSYWPALWRELPKLSLKDAGTRLCVTWFIVTFVIFSAVSGKQLHYMLPLFPAVALLAANLLARSNKPVSVVSQSIPAILLIGLIVLLLALPYSSKSLPFWFAEGRWTAVLLAAVPAAMLLFVRTLKTAVAMLTITSVTLMIVMLIALQPVFNKVASLDAVSQIIARAQIEQKPVAHLLKYNNQYHFPGRLTEPLVILSEQALPDWVAAHPDGLVISYHENCYGSPKGPIHTQYYLDRRLFVWQSAYLREQPNDYVLTVCGEPVGS